VLSRDPAPPGHKLWADSQAAGITNGPSKGAQWTAPQSNSNTVARLYVSPSEHTF
jgi:hypothetical protein